MNFLRRPDTAAGRINPQNYSLDAFITLKRVEIIYNLFRIGYRTLNFNDAYLIRQAETFVVTVYGTDKKDQGGKHEKQQGKGPYYAYDWLDVHVISEKKAPTASITVGAGV
jgi:hypothetical protein